jgi:hypothetical protein
MELCKETLQRSPGESLQGDGIEKRRGRGGDGVLRDVVRRMGYMG